MDPIFFELAQLLAVRVIEETDCRARFKDFFSCVKFCESVRAEQQVHDALWNRERDRLCQDTEGARKIAPASTLTRFQRQRRPLERRYRASSEY